MVELIPGKQKQEFQSDDVIVLVDGTRLSIANSRISRELDLGSGMPVTISLTDPVAGVELADPTGDDADFRFMGYTTPFNDDVVSYRVSRILCEEREDGLFAARHVLVIVEIEESIQKITFGREYMVFPGLPVISCRTGISAAAQPNIFWTRRGDLHTLTRHGVGFLESCVDSFRLRSCPDHLETVEFAGRTDYGNDHVRQTEYDPAASVIRTMGNLLVCDFEGTGIFVLQQAPPSSERRDMEEYDFRIEGGRVHSLCWGINPWEVSPDQMLFSYWHTVGVFHGGRIEMAKALKDYLRMRFGQDHERDFSVTVNPWGCGQFPQLLSEEFLCAEIEAAGRLNATHYQIDDGWQSGRSLGVMVEHNKAADKEFWSVCREVLPDGFRPIRQAAEDAGVELALWMAPSFNQDYRDWEVFADLAYGYYRDYGFRMFKLDAIRTRTKAAEDNLERMLRVLRERTGGDILFNLDTTNGQRPGYFLFLEYGNIFLENRYACHEWGQRYHPEITLRNLWRLSRYVRPQSLQIEVTDPALINAVTYKRDGVNRPDEYSPEYWAAVTLFANPLIWLSPSRLAPDVADAYARIIDLHRTHRKGVFGGEIFPVGAEPDGGSWAGLQSHRAEDNSGYLVVYRELQAPKFVTVELHFVNETPLTLHSLCDDSEPIDKPGGTSAVTLTLPSPGSFRLYRYTPLS